MVEQFSEQKFNTDETGSSAQAALQSTPHAAPQGSPQATLQSTPQAAPQAAIPAAPHAAPQGSPQAPGAGSMQSGYQPHATGGYAPQNQTPSAAYAAYPGYLPQTAPLAPAKAIGKGALIFSGIILLLLALIRIGMYTFSDLSSISTFTGDAFTLGYLVVAHGASLLESSVILATAIAAFVFAGKTKERGGLIAWGGIGFGMTFCSLTAMLIHAYNFFARAIFDPSHYTFDPISAVLIVSLLLSFLALIFTVVMMSVGFKRLKSNDTNK